MSKNTAKCIFITSPYMGFKKWQNIHDSVDEIARKKN
jgi:hypothetical protein